MEKWRNLTDDAAYQRVNRDVGDQELPPAAQALGADGAAAERRLDRSGSLSGNRGRPARLAFLRSRYRLSTRLAGPHSPRRKLPRFETTGGLGVPRTASNPRCISSSPTGRPSGSVPAAIRRSRFRRSRRMPISRTFIPEGPQYVSLGPVGRSMGDAHQIDAVLRRPIGQSFLIDGSSLWECGPASLDKSRYQDHRNAMRAGLPRSPERERPRSRRREPGRPPRV